MRQLLVLVEVVVFDRLLVVHIRVGAPVPVREGVRLAVGDVGRGDLGVRPVRTERVPGALRQRDFYDIDANRFPEGVGFGGTGGLTLLDRVHRLVLLGQVCLGRGLLVAAGLLAGRTGLIPGGLRLDGRGLLVAGHVGLVPGALRLGIAGVAPSR